MTTLSELRYSHENTRTAIKSVDEAGVKVWETVVVPLGWLPFAAGGPTRSIVLPSNGVTVTPMLRYTENAEEPSAWTAVTV